MAILMGIIFTVTEVLNYELLEVKLFNFNMKSFIRNNKEKKIF
jgi:hypothetical protein